jgi:hypothetical protein
MTRRQLGDTLVEIAEGAISAAAGTPIVVRTIAVTLPIEIALQRRGDDWCVLGDLPRLVTRTAFDTTPSRLDVTWISGDLA